MKTDVVVIGGSAAGIVAAVTGKASYPDKDFILIREEDKVVVPCGIPYIFGSLEGTEKDMISDGVLTNAGIGLKVGRVVAIDQKNKICRMEDGTEIEFEKLVLATGSKPKVPGWLKGADLENVFTIPKSKKYLDEMIEKLEQCRKVVTIGGGFIGVEVSDELNKKGRKSQSLRFYPMCLVLHLMRR